MRTPLLLLATILGGCGNPCSDGAAQCSPDGDAEICIDGEWSLQATCDSDETCEVEAGVAYCAGPSPEPADVD